MFEGDLLFLWTKGWLHLNSKLHPKLPGPPLLGRAGRQSRGRGNSPLGAGATQRAGAVPGCPRGEAAAGHGTGPGAPARTCGPQGGWGMVPGSSPPCAPSMHPSHGHGSPWGCSEMMGHRGQNTAPSPSAGQRHTPKQPNPPYLWVLASYGLLRLLFMPTTTCTSKRRNNHHFG